MTLTSWNSFKSLPSHYVGRVAKLALLGNTQHINNGHELDSSIVLIRPSPPTCAIWASIIVPV
jgi:hypothetical protein